MKLTNLVGTAVLLAVCTAAPVQAQSDVVLNKLNLQGVNYNAATGTLTATGGTVSGLLGGLPFTTDVKNFTLQALQGNGRRCSVLHLELAPIQIHLLGLHVDTSQICLDITAFRGQGVLGDLLCGLAGGNLPLLNSLGNPSGVGLPNLLSGLSDILNTALGRAKPVHGNGNGNGNGGGNESVCTGECEVLDLVLGPVTLNLLGVQVKLDDCNGGPVEVCVSATASEGLLGEILCGLVDGGLLDGINLGDLLGLIRGILNGLPVG